MPNDKSQTTDPELMFAFQDGQPQCSITPTYLTLVEAERMVRRACGMSRAVPLPALANMLEKVASELRDAEVERTR